MHSSFSVNIWTLLLKELPFVSLENNSAAVLCPVICINDITNKTEKCGKGMTYIGLNRDLNWQLLKPRSIAITVQPYHCFRWQIMFFVCLALRIGCLIFLSLLVFIRLVFLCWCLVLIFLSLLVFRLNCFSLLVFRLNFFFLCWCLVLIFLSLLAFRLYSFFLC